MRHLRSARIQCRRLPTRATLLGLFALVTASCALGGRGHLVLGGPEAEEGPICGVRVTNAYHESVEAGVRARTEWLELGELEPDDDVELGVPCSFGSVTVFRIVRNGSGAPDAWIRPLSRALDPRKITTFTLRPSTVRGSSTPRP